MQLIECILSYNLKTVVFSSIRTFSCSLFLVKSNQLVIISIIPVKGTSPPQTSSLSAFCFWISVAVQAAAQWEGHFAVKMSDYFRGWHRVLSSGPTDIVEHGHSPQIRLWSQNSPHHRAHLYLPVKTNSIIVTISFHSRPRPKVVQLKKETR